MAEGAGRILLLGGGNMGAALLGGWLNAGIDPLGVTVVDPHVGEGLRPSLERGVVHSLAVPEGPFDTVVLAVKPQMMGDALPALTSALTPQTLVISIAAGTSVAFIESRLASAAIIRAMPNTPALIGRGITGCYASPVVSDAQRRTAETLLSASGPVEWVGEEQLIDAVTAVSGSGPAYVFYLAEALAAAGEAAGLDPDLAMRLARHTVAGAGELMVRSDDPPSQLRRNVTSPNGTTQAALDVLMADDGLAPLMRRAVAAAKTRAEELSKG